MRSLSSWQCSASDVVPPGGSALECSVSPQGDRGFSRLLFLSSRPHPTIRFQWFTAGFSIVFNNALGHKLIYQLIQSNSNSLEGIVSQARVWFFCSDPRRVPPTRTIPLCSPANQPAYSLAGVLNLPNASTILESTLRLELLHPPVQVWSVPGKESRSYLFCLCFSTHTKISEPGLSEVGIATQRNSMQNFERMTKLIENNEVCADVERSPVYIIKRKEQHGTDQCEYFDPFHVHFSTT